MPEFCVKELAVIGNISVSMTDSKEDLDKTSVVWDL